MNCKSLLLLLVLGALMVAVASAQEEDVGEVPKEDQAQPEEEVVVQPAQEEQPAIVVEEEQPIPEPTPLPPVCLGTSESNIECGVSRLRALSSFLYAVDPKALHVNPQASRFSCVSSTALVAAYDRFANDNVRENTSDSGAAILSGCESQHFAGQVCLSELDDNTCTCLNRCDYIRAMNAAGRAVARARNSGRFA